jgi:apolipoprotein N-acyltransferase
MNTGVSAVIDAYGRVLAALDMEREGVIDHALPPARVATPYGRWHDGMLLLLVCFLALPVALIGAKKNGRRA